MSEPRAQGNGRTAQLEPEAPALVPLSLPFRPVPPPAAGELPERVTCKLEASLLARLEQAAASHGSTLPRVLLTTVGLVLARWGASACFGITLRVGVQGIPTVVRLDLRQVTDLAGACSPLQARLQSGSLVGAAVGWLSTAPAGAWPWATTVTLAPEHGQWASEGQAPQLWVELNPLQSESGRVLEVSWSCTHGALYPGVLTAMCGALEKLLGFAAEAPQWRAGLPELLPADMWQCRCQVNGTTAPLPTGLLHSGFLAQAEQAPGRVALCWGSGQQWTYAELLARVQGIAGLLRDRGCGPGERVAVTMAKGPLQIAAVLAVSACGAAYVPVGVEQPVARRARIYKRAAVSVVLMDEARRGEAEEAWAGLCLWVGEHVQSARPLPDAQVSPADLAYIIYTSGSTGEPKGVEISHGAALNTIEDINRRFAVSQLDRVLAVSALDFDLSVYDIFGLLGVGGSLVLPHEYERRNPHAWQQLVLRWQVTLWNSVPALLDMLLAPPDAELGMLRLVMLSGDWIGLDLPARLRSRNAACRFVALGGATEASIWSNWYEVQEVEAAWPSIPYGYPLANQQFRVVDAQGRDCPDWVAGELWIGGAGVALGYRGDPQRTAQQLVVWQGQRWYRTGDQGRYWPGGRLEFLGRADQQVKIRGHRIELGEVESALKQHPQVIEAVALAVGERQPRLAAVVAGNGGLSAQAVRDFVGNTLPVYALPEQLEVVERLPLTANGKVDRKALLAYCRTRTQQGAGVPGAAEVTAEDSEALRGPEELLVAKLWSELLGCGESLGREDDFLRLGGDRVVAARFVERVHEQGYVNVRVQDVMKCSLLKHLAQVLRLKKRAGRAKAGVAPLS